MRKEEMSIKLTKKQKKWLLRIVLGAIGFGILSILEHTGVCEGDRWWIGLIAAIIPYLIVKLPHDDRDIRRIWNRRI